MKASLDRREFLAGSSRLVAGVAAFSLVRGATAAEEQKRNLAQPSNCLACRDTQLKETGQRDCWAALQSIGAEGVEAEVADDLSLRVLYHPERRYSLADDANIAVLTADMKAAGKRISALCMHNRFEERPDFEVDWAAKAARAAQSLGVKAIRIDLAPRKQPVAEFLGFSVTLMKRLLERTAATDVAFAIENHGKVTNDPDFLQPLLDRVGSPRLGVTLDTGNFYWYGHPLAKVYELYEKFAPHVRHTHIKSIRYPESEREKRRAIGWGYAKYTCPIYEGDIDFHRVVKILRTAGYTGDLCLEDESLDKFPAAERGPILAKEISYLKGCL